MKTSKEIVLKWWKSLTFEEKFYEVIKWLKDQDRDVTERHPNDLTDEEIQEIFVKSMADEIIKTKLNHENH